MIVTSLEVVWLTLVEVTEVVVKDSLTTGLGEGLGAVTTSIRVRSALLLLGRVTVTVWTP